MAGRLCLTGLFRCGISSSEAEQSCVAVGPGAIHPGENSMTTQPQSRAFTVGEYNRMAEADILTEEDRVELIAGQIVAMSPIGSRHAACVKRLNLMMGKIVGDSMLIGVQDPIVLGKYSEPEPDLVLLRPRTDFPYATARPHKSLVSTIPQAQPGWAAAADNRRHPLGSRAAVLACCSGARTVAFNAGLSPGSSPAPPPTARWAMPVRCSSSTGIIGTLPVSAPRPRLHPGQQPAAVLLAAEFVRRQRPPLRPRRQRHRRLRRLLPPRRLLRRSRTGQAAGPGPGDDRPARRPAAAAERPQPFQQRDRHLLVPAAAGTGAVECSP